MKKIVVTLAIAISSLGAFASEGTVAKKVLDAFQSEFITAKEVEWTTGENYYQARFLYNDRYVHAYYDMDGELLGMSRYLSPLDLPLGLQNNLKKNYAGYWISDLFEVVRGEDTHYYVTIENGDSRIVLQSSGNSWNSYKKVKKS